MVSASMQEKKKAKDSSKVSDESERGELQNNEEASTGIMVRRFQQEGACKESEVRNWSSHLPINS